MNVLEVRLQPGTCEAEQTVRLFVNGRDLVALVADFERPFAGDLAGAYGLLPAADVLPPARHFLGEPDRLYVAEGGRTMLLACECAEPGCWPLAARIVATTDSVTWTDFQQPHRSEWSYAGFGPFVFERAQYEAALARAAAVHPADHT